MQVFYTPGAVSVIDVVYAGAVVGAFSGKTLEETRETSPDAVLMDHEEARALIDAGFIKPVREIDADGYMQALECLPPSKWRQSAGVESFHICERITGNIVNWYAQCGRRYFAFTDEATLPLDQIGAKVHAFIAA